MNSPEAQVDPSRNPCVPVGVCVYAIGDIHGRADLLRGLLDLIAADVERRAPSRLALVFLGDFIDRGPHSRQVVECLMAGPPPGPLAAAQWICLKGNHEEVMLDFLDNVAAGKGWCAYGGLDTVRSYAASPPAPGWERDLKVVQAVLARSLPKAHRDFLAGLPVCHQEGDYLFVHAGIRPGTALEYQDPADLLWIRHEFLDDGRWHGKVVVHGHTPTPEPEVRHNRIGIDTRAYDSNRLTALVLHGDEHAFLRT